jgi:hypothetical protein
MAGHGSTDGQQRSVGTQTLVSSIEKSVNEWPEWFQDLVDGNDIRRWQTIAVDELAPVALQGFERNGISVGGIFQEGDIVDLAVPAFFNKADPGVAVGPGGKAKLKGLTQGLVFLMGDQLGFVHELGSVYMLYRTKPGEVRAAYEVKFAFSLSSMTSAGPGYEVILDDGPIVFRLALEFKRGTYKQDRFETLLTKLTAPTGSD